MDPNLDENELGRTYEQTTQDISISVLPVYQASHSHPEANHFFWTYTITIKNMSAAPAQLMSRHWIITDATGHVEEVRGEGVVGQQPVIEPGQSFTYTSGCPLKTTSGSMRGSYSMNQNGESFAVTIPVFFLESVVVYH